MPEEAPITTIFDMAIKQAGKRKVRRGRKDIGIVRY
jgi:hypothetical protein